MISSCFARFFKVAYLIFIATVTLVCLMVSSASANDGDSAEQPKIVTTPPADRAEAMDILEQKFIWSEDRTFVGVDQYGRQVSQSSSTQFYIGRYKRPLHGVEFYETVQSPELASRYRSRRRTRRGLMGVGLAGAIVGPFVMMAPLFRADSGTQPDDMVPWLIGGGVITVVGSAAMAVGMAINPHPIEPYEAREIAERYNLQLIDELDLDEEELLDEDNESGIHDLRVDLFFGDDSSGLTVGFRF